MKNVPVKEIFKEIYSTGARGRSEDVTDFYYSGTGHSQSLNAVDLGCGDFAIGSKLRHHFNNYIACFRYY